MDRGYNYLLAKMAERNANPGREEEIDRALWAELGDRGAILASDSAGFTLITRTRGTPHFLSMIQKGIAISLPIIEQEGGVLAKQEADNMLTTFPAPSAALRAATRIVLDLRAHNESVADLDSRIHYSFGIGFGGFLRFSHDIFGDEVNVASKLAEDTAQKEEVLLNKAATDQLDELPERWSLAPWEKVWHGGTELEYRKAAYPPPGLRAISQDHSRSEKKTT
jgi:class 3 adenylate cyclase